MAASTRYDYGTEQRGSASATQRRELAEQIALYHIGKQPLVPLRTSYTCGLSAELLAYAGIWLETLLEHFLLDQLVADLNLDWHALRLLRFAPQMLANHARCPLIVCYDAGMRADALLEFASLRAEALKPLLGEMGLQMLHIKPMAWPITTTTTSNKR